MMLDFAIIPVPKIIEPQAVLLAIYQVKQLGLDPDHRRRIRHALEDGILDTLPIVHAMLGHTAKSPSPFGILGVNVIGNHGQHSRAPHFHKNAG